MRNSGGGFAEKSNANGERRTANGCRTLCGIIFPLDRSRII